jgi:hypothetical protein
MLLAVSDARVGHSLCVKPEKVVVLCNDDAPAGSGESKVYQVGSADQTRAYGGSHVNVALPKAGRDVG